MPKHMATIIFSARWPAREPGAARGGGNTRIPRQPAPTPPTTRRCVAGMPWPCERGVRSASASSVGLARRSPIALAAASDSPHARQSPRTAQARRARHGPAHSMFCTCSGRSAGKAHGCRVSGFEVLGGYTCGYTGIGGWSCVVAEQRSGDAHLPPTCDFAPVAVTSDAARKVDGLRSSRSVRLSSQLISPRGSRDARRHRQSAWCEGSNARGRTLPGEESHELVRTFHARGFDPTPGCR